MQIERTNSDALMVNKLPDGSSVIVDSQERDGLRTERDGWRSLGRVQHPTTLAGVTESMQTIVRSRNKRRVAEEAILQLQDKKLVRTSGVSSQARRQFLTT